LVIQMSGGAVVEHAPVMYQEGPGGRETVSGRFVLEGDGTVGFTVDGYDPSRPLVIDPVLSYSTYLGGSGADAGHGIVVDSAGHVSLSGQTGSADFPGAGGSLGGGQDAFVAKLNAAGTALVYSTYLGGSGSDLAYGIALDSSGNVYVTGNTQSSDF